jgi:drug/metabolite transporter (DMT)-like permease
MIFLLGSIILSSYLTLAFKVCEKYGIDIFQAIVFNYITCVITGSIVNGAFPISVQSFHYAWVQWGFLMGGLFISLFNLIGITTQKDGVAVATVANKLSLVIPVMLAVYLYGEVVQGYKMVGIIAALIAVVLTCYQPAADRERMVGSTSRHFNYLLPVILFIGSGLLDSIINHVQKKYITEENSNAFLITGFFSAALIGAVVLMIQYSREKKFFATKNLLGGILIGIPNYFSIWCLMKFLKNSPWQSSAKIPVNNMGIVLFSSVVAWLLFKEKLSLINWAGILLSIAAIALIAFG